MILKKLFTKRLTIITVFALLLIACKKDPFDANSGTFTDKRDGHVYKWVKIGQQICT